MIYGRVFSVYHIPHLILELVISQIGKKEIIRFERLGRKKSSRTLIDLLSD